MGKPDKNQPKLQFEQTKKTMEQTIEGHAGTQAGATSMNTDTPIDFQAMFNTIQSTLSNIDAKIDALTYQVDRMSERIDKHTERIDMAERRISDLEDTHTQLDTNKPQWTKQ